VRAGDDVGLKGGDGDNDGDNDGRRACNTVGSESQGTSSCWG